MKTNYREIVGMPKLAPTLGITSLKTDLNLKQKKAVKNIKYCANDQWQFVNSWYDEKSEDARRFMMDPKALFNTIYKESMENVYDEGFCGFGGGAASYLKDIRFCGKQFLQTVTFYYLAKLLEDSVPEVDGTEEDAERVANELLALKAELGL